MDYLTRSLDAELVPAEGRRVTVRLCRWDEIRDVRDPGIAYRETYPPGSLELAPDVHVVNRHDTDVRERAALIGRADTSSWRPYSPDGPEVDLILSETPEADEILAHVRSGVIRSVSMELEPLDAEPREITPGALVRRLRSVVHGIAFAFRPQHSAPVLAVRSHDPQTERSVPMDKDTAPAPAPAPEVLSPDLITGGELARSLDELRDDLTRTMLAQAPAAPVVSPLSGISDLGSYLRAVREEPDNLLLRRALADSTTEGGTNAGVIPPGWLRDVYGIVSAAREVVGSFGTAPLPSNGLEVDWPYFDGDLTTLVGEQATQKTPITSVAVDIKKGSSPIKTYAGGGDIAYQLITRSEPPFLSTYLELMAAAYGLATEAAFSSAVAAAAVASSATWDPATGSLGDLASAVFIAGHEVKTATGAPAQFVLCSPDVYPAVGAYAIQSAQAYGTQNLPGTADARNDSVSIAGLTVREGAFLPIGTVIVSNTRAASWHQDGPFTVTSEDVEKLGRNVAVWGMGAPAVTLANGIRKIPAA